MFWITYLRVLELFMFNDAGLSNCCLFISWNFALLSMSNFASRSRVFRSLLKRQVALKWYLISFWSKHQRCSKKNVVLKNFSKFRGKHLCQSLVFNKLQAFWHKCFPVNFQKFLRTSFLQNTSRQLLLFILHFRILTRICNSP